MKAASPVVLRSFSSHNPHFRACSGPCCWPQGDTCIYEMTSQDLVHQSLMPGDVTRWFLPLPGSRGSLPSEHPSLPYAATLRAMLPVGARLPARAWGTTFLSISHSDLGFAPEGMEKWVRERAVVHKAQLSLDQMLSPLMPLWENFPLPRLDPWGHGMKLWGGAVCEDSSSWSIFPSLYLLFPFPTSNMVAGSDLTVSGQRVVPLSVSGSWSRGDAACKPLWVVLSRSSLKETHPGSERSERKRLWRECLKEIRLPKLPSCSLISPPNWKQRPQAGVEDKAWDVLAGFLLLHHRSPQS